LTILSGLHFVEFNVLQEPWSTYKLKDGTTLRVKVVLKSLLKESDSSFSIGTNNVVAAIPNPNLVGLPSKLSKGDFDLESNIEAEDLEITEKTEVWNVYELPSEKTLLKIMGVVVSVSRTNKHDEKGIPLYIVNIQCVVKPQKIK
jgi:hypothetical protein